MVNQPASLNVMDLLLSVVADPEGANMLKHTKLFTREGGSFGRADSNDWVLPDPQRVVSSRHGEIQFADNRYFLVDQSTNGTYHNQSADPLGKGNRTPLADGDVISLGDYQLKVSVRQPKPDSSLPKGLGDADFLDNADRTTFSPAAAAKMQSNKEAEELDSWLEPGASAQSNQSGEWGYLTGAGTDTPASGLGGDGFDSLLGQNTPTDPLQVLNRGNSSAADGLTGGISNNGFDPLSDFAASPSPAPASQWGDDDAWWKDGSEQDHAPAHSHAMQFPAQQEAVQAPQSPPSRERIAPQPARPVPQRAPESVPQVPVPPAQPPADNPFAESFSEVAGDQVSGAPGFGGLDTAPVSVAAANPQHAPPDFPGLEVAGATPVPPTHGFAQGSQQFSQPAVAPAATTPGGAIAPAAPQAQSTQATTASSLAQQLGLQLQGEQLAQLDAQAAAIVEESVARLIDLLRARTSIKNELRVQRTMIQTEANNPLKFSATAKDALGAMFTGTGAFMTPVEAVRDSFDDLSDHQVAVLSGMRAGYEAMLKYFSPENIERRGGKQSGVFSSKSARNWENYVDAYRQLVGDPENCYRRLFGEEFASTYESQLSELKNARSLNK
ncbi:type VI secretion system-associated FHA domain protein TagH [Microbulbifer sp. HZ11]|uniref:type VI secretion system-associated FHA domain protein TagH n=1 Tax=Microbulbifer sp. HZ11 TaxID=1453501 RepID=UPI0018CC5252|nr:type VI secretion system-associated FHA domain protein TagH [Microbulbifer sp. HZ11]